MEAQQHGDQLKRGLKTAIYSSSHWVVLSAQACFWEAHPSSSLPVRIILGYAIAGFIAFLIMRQLGEMVVEEPVAGSFSHLPTNTGAVLPVSLPAGTTGCFTFWWPWQN